MSRRHPIEMELDLDSSYLRTIPEDGDNDSTSQQRSTFHLPQSSSPSPRHQVARPLDMRPDRGGEGRRNNNNGSGGAASIVHTDRADLETQEASNAAGGPQQRQRQQQRAHHRSTRRMFLFSGGWGDLSKNTRLAIVFAAVLTILVVIAIVLVVVLASSPEPPVESPLNSTDAPSSSPAPSPELAPTYSPSTVAEIDKVLYTVSDPVDFEDPDSPQSKARTWMLEEDLLLEEVLAEGDDRVAQRYVCAELLFSLQVDDGDTNSSSNNDTLAYQSECEWAGFSCTDAVPGHTVNTIELVGMNLTGSLPDEIANLTYLQELILTNNSITGTIPSAWFSPGALQILFHLDLGGNQLTGTIPKQLWDSFPDLRFLYLNNNKFEGTIDSPTSSTDTAALNDTIMQEIWLDHNALTGTFPKWMLESYPNLENIRLDSNSLTGPLPQDELIWPSNLKYLYLYANRFTGNLPSSLFFLESLTYLDLSNNSFSGPLPDFTSNLPSSAILSMEKVKLHDNRLSGSFPRDFGSLWTNLKKLLLHNNSITGTISEDLCNKWINLTLASVDCEAVECACCSECS